MSERDDTLSESQITTDRETVKEWAEETGAQPARHEGAAGEDLALLPESEYSSEYERLEWDEFFRELDRTDNVVVYHGSGADRTFRVMDHDRAVSMSSVSGDEISDRLMEGDTVTTEVTETTVVEETIVEHADIESELVHSEQVSSEIVDADLRSREVLDCEVVGFDEHTTMHDEELFTVGHRTDEEFEVVVHVEESWDVTRETAEQVAIESRVVDTDVETSESIESEAVETRVDLGDIERTILQSGVIDSEHDVETMETKSIQSGFTEDDSVITELVERKTIEEEMTVMRDYTGTIDESETTEVTTVRTDVVSSEMAETEEYDLGELDVDAYDRTGTATDTGTAGTMDTDESVRVMPDEDDRGKTVVDQSGEEVGIVEDVQSGSMYVDPHPSITDKIQAKLGWGDADEDSYLLESEQIAEITDDEVHLQGQRTDTSG